MRDSQIDALRSRLRIGQLPGLHAHREVMSYIRESAEEVRKSGKAARQSAVMLLLYPHLDQMHTSLIIRPEYEGVHSGQIALPGGAMEAEDLDLMATALRETEEEIGLSPTQVEVLGALSEIYIPPSNFLVQPFVGLTPSRPNFIPDPREVAGVLEVPVADLLLEGAIRKRSITLRDGLRLKVDCFELGGKVVWGATAMMLAEFKGLLSEL